MAKPTRASSSVRVGTAKGAYRAPKRPSSAGGKATRQGSAGSRADQFAGSGLEPRNYSASDSGFGVEASYKNAGLSPQQSQIAKNAGMTPYEWLQSQYKAKQAAAAAQPGYVPPNPAISQTQNYSIDPTTGAITTGTSSSQTGNNQPVTGGSPPPPTYGNPSPTPPPTAPAPSPTPTVTGTTPPPKTASVAPNLPPTSTEPRAATTPTTLYDIDPLGNVSVTPSLPKIGTLPKV
jgi:hypothetical protein